ncbi:ribosome hibernation-promoting factor, HPF/YfiA family [Planctomicrobium sp. SH527]|uniref:ribosome hibernation-promoting factor, HPF/YfiA family n=1 Tax=Planctomicrobium sp. SH527 TaxID=3448123 RepID=UPI003F5CA688
MQIEITCRHGSISPDFHDYISRKTAKLLNHFERVTSIQVTLDYEGGRVKTEILVNSEHKHDFVTSQTTGEEEAGACFDQALAKMDQQIRKYKDKIQDHRRDKPLNELAAGSLEEAPE